MGEWTLVSGQHVNHHGLLKGLCEGMNNVEFLTTSVVVESIFVDIESSAPERAPDDIVWSFRYCGNASYFQSKRSNVVMYSLVSI